MKLSRCLAPVLWFSCVLASGFAAAPTPIPLWPGTVPDEPKALSPEADMNKPTDPLIAGRPIIRLGNVSSPTLTIYPAPADKNTGAAVLVLPGGAFTNRRELTGKDGGPVQTQTETVQFYLPDNGR